MSDLIERQLAINAIRALEKPAPTAQHLSAIFDCEDVITSLPSAQPEPEHTMEEFMYGQELGDPEDGSL